MTGFDKITIAAAFGRLSTIHQFNLDHTVSHCQCCSNFILAFPAPDFIMVSPFALIAPTTKESNDIETI